MRSALLLAVAALSAASANAFAAAPATAPAAAPATSAGQLYAFVLASLQDDEHELATSGLINPSLPTPKVVLNPTFPFAASDQSSLDCFLGFDFTSNAYIASSGADPEVLVIDAATGKVRSKATVQPPGVWFILAWAWDARTGTVLAALANNTGAYLADINATSGEVALRSAGPLPHPYLEPCEAAVLPSRGWLLVQASDKQMDDSDTTFDLVDYASGPHPVVVRSVPWSFQKNGRVNAYTLLPPTSGSDVVLALSKPDDDSAGPSLVAIDVASGNATVVTLHTWPKKGFGQVTVTLGTLTVRETAPGASYTLYALSRNMGTEEPYLLVMELAIARGAVFPTLVNATALPMNEEGVAGDVYGLVWAPSA